MSGMLLTSVVTSPAGWATISPMTSPPRRSTGRSSGACYDLERPYGRPWLYGIAANVIAQYHRKETRMLRAFARSGADPVAQTYGGQLDRVDDRVAAAAMHQPLAAALAGLSSAHREILLLIAWADLSYEETAQALGTSVGTVRSRLHRARRKIRDALGDKSPLSISEER
jgi:RNA polymerase sigma-70 factor (ECF subfamily)